MPSDRSGPNPFPATWAEMGPKSDGARRAVDQGDAEQEDRGGHRADHEVLEARLGRPGVVALERREDVGADRDELEGDEHRHEVGDARHEHHADEGEQQDPVELAVAAVHARGVRRGDERQEHPRAEHHAADEPAEAVDHEVPEDRAARAAVEDEDQEGDGEAEARDQGHDPGPARRGEQEVRRHEQQDRRDDEDLGQEQVEVEVHGHFTSLRAWAASRDFTMGDTPCSMSERRGFGQKPKRRSTLASTR